MRAVIVGYSRSPFTRAHKGKLANIRPDDLAAQVAKNLVIDSEIDPSSFDDLILGCAYPEGEQGFNLGRIIAHLSGLPDSVPGVTINRLCGSSMDAVHHAVGSISRLSGDCFLCGGVESMSRVKRRGFNWSPNPKLLNEYPEAYISMGITAENVADIHAISRTEQEKFALSSHNKASNARILGNFDDEIISIYLKNDTISIDDCIRDDTTLDAMAKLNPAFQEDGVVTAATSSPLTDGAAFLIVCSEKFVIENKLKPLAYILSTSITGVSPSIMGIGPVSASKLALERAKLSIDQIDVIELNEAFSSQTLAVIKELGISEKIVNLDGGALAIGHPLGASGARILGKAMNLLIRTKKRYGLATMCIGGGMGIATILENADN